MAYVDNHFQRISSHDQTQEQSSPLTEPVIVPSSFITGGAFEISDTTVRWVGWEETPSINGEMTERRIVTRVVMSNSTARDMATVLRSMLTKGGH